MALRTADDDPKLNPGQQHSDNQFNALKKAESDGTINPNSNINADGINNAEESPSGNWQNNVSGNSQRSTAGGRLSFVKKKGPLTAIILTLVGGGIGIGGLLSPGLLLVQLKEVMVNKFNSQLTSMDIRTTKILSSKTTGGMLCKSLSVGCKYSSMSEKQIVNFEKAGITVESEGKTVLGRSKPKSFKFNGETISAGDFEKTLISNPEFRSAVKTGYNPKFAGFADTFWGKAASKLGITKAKAKIDTSSDQKALKSIQEDTKTKSTVQESEAQPIKEGEPKPDGSGPYTAAEEAANKIEIAAGEIEGELAEDAAKIAEKSAKTGVVALEGVEVVGSALKITGLTDAACTAYGAIQGLGYAAKSIRALQMAKYAMIFLNVADQIKAGVAKPEDVSYLGTVLTTEVKATGKTATDSFGYKYAAYSEAGTMPTSATQYLAGGGLTGSLIGITSIIDKNLPANKKVCGVLKNPFVAGGSLIVGIGLFFVPGANVAIGAWDIAKGVGIAALAIATAYIPAALGDIVAGVLVDKTTVGESAGDAITSGASGVMGTTANTGGNAPLTPKQAVAYNNLSNNIASQYAEEDRITLNPFDITNSNTLMGNITSRLIPYLSKISSLSGVFSSIASITTESIASITTQSVKADDGGYDYKACQDFDYRELGVATDPYCNVTYGIPVESLDVNPIKVTESLSGEIDPVSGDPLPGSAYETFVTNCINRNRPLGDTGDDPLGSNGSECMFGAKVAIEGSTQTKNDNYYIHYIDQRVQKGMDGEDPVLAAAENSGQRNISFFDSNTAYNTTALNTGGSQ